MGFFCGLGAGKGSYQAFFVPTAEDLRSALAEADALLIVVNGCVRNEYDSTPLDEYVASYARYLSMVLAGTETDWKIIEPLMISLTHRGTAFTARPARDPQFKCIEPSEPVVNVMPLHLERWQGRLVVNAGGSDSAVFGLVVSYPKVYFSRADGFETPYSTEALENRRLFDHFTEVLHTGAHPCVFETNGRSIRTRIRLSPALDERINNHSFLKAMGVRVAFRAKRRRR